MFTPTYKLKPIVAHTVHDMAKNVRLRAAGANRTYVCSHDSSVGWVSPQGVTQQIPQTSRWVTVLRT